MLHTFTLHRNLSRSIRRLTVFSFLALIICALPIVSLASRPRRQQQQQKLQQRQQPQQKQQEQEVRQRQHRSRRALHPLALQPITAPPRSIETAPDVLSGDVAVRVTANGAATFRLGLAPHGVALIEFRADDPIYGLHPGDENFVTVDRENRRATDALVIRPGKGFTVPPAHSSEPVPTTIITVQRVSGIVVSFIIVPVRDASQNANRVVVSYNLAEVLEARRRAGLAVNLISPTELAAAGVVIPQIIAAPAKADTVAVSTSAAVATITTNPIKTASTTATDLSATAGSENTSDTLPPQDAIADATLAELRRVGNSRLTLNFSKPMHGLSLAVAPRVHARTSDVVVEVIAVRNTLPQAVRLVPDQPELFIENRPERKSPAVISGRVPVRFVATTLDDDDVLQPGVTYYMAFAYDAPLLGAKQLLRVGLAQTNASDEPTSVDLVSSAR